MRRGLIGALLVSAVFAAVATGATSLTTDAANPTWSPDGKSIAFASLSYPRETVVTIPASGGSPHRLFAPRDSCCEPVLWAAGNRVVFASNFQLYAVAATGGTPTKLFDDTPWFILSPNRETAAVDYGCGCGHAADSVAFVDVRGGRFVVSRPADATDSIDGFSPDGTELVFTRGAFDPEGGPPAFPSALMAVHVGTTTPVPLAQSGIVGASFVPARAVDVQWSPDGRWIAYRADGGTLQIVATRGGAARVLVPAALHAGSYAWSPTSKRIAYTTASGRGRLATVDLAGHRKPLWTNASLHYLSNDSWDRPQWSPDGTKLVFMAVVGPGRPTAHIWVVGATGRGLRKVF